MKIGTSPLFPCRTCDGRGFLTSRRPLPGRRRHKCPRCGGSGEEPNPRTPRGAA